MPRHNFDCGKCNAPNIVDVSPQCGCHECEARRPQNSKYRAMINGIRAGAVVVTVALLMIPSGCYINNHFEQKKAEVSQRQVQDAEVAKLKAAIDGDVKKIETEVKRIEAMRTLTAEMNKFDVKSSLTPDGKVAITLTPKDK
jgi:hypothetical protein